MVGILSRRSELDPKLEGVLAALCLRLGEVTKTKAVKLPYLVDVLASCDLGHRITNATYQAWEYGVVATEVWRAVTRERLGPNFEVRPHQYSEGGQLLRLAKPNQQIPLSPEEEAVVEFIADKFGKLNAAQLGTLTKQLNPEIETWGSNQEARVDEDACARLLSPGWQELCRTLHRLDLSNELQWGPPITDVDEYLRDAFSEQIGQAVPTHLA
jgi:uncharacterized phage-associated protein